MTLLASQATQRRTAALRRALNRRGAATEDPIASLQMRVQELQEENARLRLEQQQAASLGQVVQHAAALDATAQSASPVDRRSQPGDLVPAPRAANPVRGHRPEDELDVSWSVLARAEMQRTAVVGVLRELQVVCARLEKQITHDLTAPEMDRRVLDFARPGEERRSGAAR